MRGRTTGGSTYHVDCGHPSASDNNPGTIDAPFLTISQAACVAVAGDEVVVHEGVYRERVAPRVGGDEDRPIIYRAVEGERVVIKGSEVWRPDFRVTDWAPHVLFGAFEPSLFLVDQRQAGDWGEAFPETLNPYRIRLSSVLSDSAEVVDVFGHVQSEASVQQSTQGQLFLNGELLRQVSSRAQLMDLPGSWMTAPEGEGLFVNFADGCPSRNDLIELTVRSRCFAPYRKGLGHIHVRGFVMEHAAADFHRGFYHPKGSPQAGLLSTRSGHHWIIEKNTIRYGQNLGIDCGTEGCIDADGLGQVELESAPGHLIRGNKISDCGAGAIHGHASPETQIVGNVLERNNALGFVAPEIGAIKMHFFVNGVIRNNLIRDNDCFGIWVDNVWVGSRISHNVILGNQGAGIFVEMGHGPLLIDHNVIALTRGGSCTSGNGDGIYSHDASAVTVAHNLLWFNAGYGLFAHQATERRARVYEDGTWNGESELCGCSDWRILKNIMVGNAMGQMALPPSVVGGNESDWNVFAGSLQRLTNETFAAALDRPLFTLLSSKGRAPLSRYVPRIPEHYDHVPLLALDDWQTISKHDLNSRYVLILRPMLASQGLHLYFIMEDFCQQNAPDIEGLDVDLLGSPVGRGAKPGPFQCLKGDPNLASHAELDTLRQIDSQHANSIRLGIPGRSQAYPAVQPRSGLVVTVV